MRNPTQPAFARELVAALELHRVGKFQQAGDIYEQILRQVPAHADALHLLGLVAHQLGRQEVAADLVRKAIKSSPRNAVYHNSLGEVLRAEGKLVEARSSYQRALKFKPDYPEARCNLGVVLQQEGKPAQAIECYLQALRLNPQFVAAYYNLGNALQIQGEYQAALQSFQEALRLDPTCAEAYSSMGRLLLDQGDSQAAVASLCQAVNLQPDLADAQCDLGEALQALGQHEAAAQCYLAALRREPDRAQTYNNLGNSLLALDKRKSAREAYEHALRLQPDLAQAHFNLGNMLRREHDLVGARASYDRALRLNPQYAETYLNKGGIYLDQGDFEAAISDFQNALRVKPDYDTAHCNVLLSLHYRPGNDAAAMFAAHRQWNEQHAAPLRASLRPWPNDRDPARRLRLGYVSADLRQHPVGFLLESVLEAHDKARFEVICYSDTEHPDDITARMKGAASGWREIRGKNAEAVSELVREDRIDILVDLAGHTEGNRLLAFALKLAPVQVSWLGYFNTTGLETMDYILSDTYLTPPGSTQQFAEQVVLLPHSRFCYKPPAYAPEVAALPARAKGIVTFGSFNNLAKLNRSVVALWTKVLDAVPGSRLVLKSKFFSNEDTRQRFLDLFHEQGTPPERLELRVGSPHLEMLGEYGEIDIALDPFPFTGGMTTLEALWMGVPVVTMEGDTMVSRQSASFLAAIGQQALIADSERAYVEIAKDLVGDLARLESLRGALRPLMQASPLCDKESFTRSLEDAYRQMWRNWCEAGH